MPKYILKCGKDTLQIEHSEGQTFEDFQAKAFTLTDIPPKNLKILVKGKMIKDNKSLLALPQGTQMKVMGTKTGQELKQTGQIKIDTMMIEQPKKIIKNGLTNIGNTCYMNSSIQFIKSVPEIDEMLRGAKFTEINNQKKMITTFLSGVLREMDTKSVQPKGLVALFLKMHPEFQPFGTQHDADQFLQKLLQDVMGSSPQYQKIIKKAFEIELVETQKNKDLQAQQPKISFSTTTKIGCALGGNNKDLKVGTLLQGIKLSLETTLQKKSPLDDQNHVYDSTTKINSLPPFLIVQMVRFFWREVNDPDSQFNKPVATKICRPVDFSAKLDLYNLCSDNLKQKLQKGRQVYEENRQKQDQIFKKEFEEYKKQRNDGNRPQARLLQDFKQKKKAEYKPLTEGLQTGMYQIHAVVTHLGNSVESGHYMAWLKQNKQQWMKYDDDTVYQQPEQKVFQLRGGQPNLQIAYLIMFRKIYAKEL